ncbi:MAG: glycosyltransferase family 2 protein [Candidatus Omnitrophota bacterium]
MKGCVLIPAYNEEMRIGYVAGEIRSKGLDCVVIDDGSLDKTKVMARQAGAYVIFHSENLGKGISLRDGFNYALTRDYDFVITMDGDGQHHPDEIENFIRAAEDSDAEIILGNRMWNPKDMPLKRRLTNWFMSMLISLMARQYIPDSQCGFRLLKTGVLKNVALITDRYEIESEVLIKASKRGFKIKSIPIKSIYKGQKSQICPFRDTLRFISFILNAGFKK